MHFAITLTLESLPDTRFPGPTFSRIKTESLDLYKIFTRENTGQRKPVFWKILDINLL